MVLSRYLVFVSFAVCMAMAYDNEDDNNTNNNNNDNNNNNHDEIILESFENPVHDWKEMNDPVMGGKSTGSFHIENGVGVFQGHVVDVPFLHAPGFIQSRTVDHGPQYPDISSCQAIKLILRASEPYTGYRFSFGNKHVPGGRYAYGFKTTLVDVPVGTDEFGEMILPFSEFTDYWNDASGDPIVTCQEDSQYCPDVETLQNIKTMAIWGEGVEGLVSLELKLISAVGCYSNLKTNHRERI